MIKPFLISFTLAALSIASAATHGITLVESSVAQGKALKAGNYQLSLKDSSVVIVKGKQQLEVPAKIENGSVKFGRTRVVYHQDNGKFSIEEIELGGTHTKVVFGNGVQNGGGE